MPPHQHGVFGREDADDEVVRMYVDVVGRRALKGGAVRTEDVLTVTAFRG